MQTPLALVFPGQGSQSLGMLAALAQQTPSIQTVFQEASDAVGYDVWALVQEGPLERLNQTELTQVAMLASDVAVYRVLQAHALPAVSFMAGHSLGEYAALVCAEALDFTEAIRLVQTRGRLMQQFVPLGQGAMAAIVGLTDEQVEQLCAQVSQAGERVTPANYNAIGQVVVAGHHAAVLRLIAAAEAAQARLAALIPVSVPCHCELLRDMSAAFLAQLNGVSVQVPRIPVIRNVDASPYTTAEEIRPYLAKQLYSPVQWVKSIQTLISRGVTHFIECGPGQVLSGLIKRIERTVPTICVNEPSGLEKACLLWGNHHDF